MDPQKRFNWDLRKLVPHKYSPDDTRDTLLDDREFPKQFQRMLNAFKAHINELGQRLTDKYAEKLDEMEVTLDLDEFLEIVWFCSMEYASYKYKIYNEWVVKNPPCKRTGTSLTSLMTGGRYMYSVDPVPTYQALPIDETETKKVVDQYEIPVIRMLDYLCRTFVYDEDIVVYRGETEKTTDIRSSVAVDLNQTFVRNKGKGDVLRIPKFVSTSMNYTVPAQFLTKEGACCYYKINVPKGTPFFPVIFASSVNEYEVLLPPCNDYVITDRSGPIVQLTVTGNSGGGYYGKEGTSSFNEQLFLDDMKMLAYQKYAIPSWQKDYMFGTTRQKWFALEKYYADGGIVGGRRRRTRSNKRKTSTKRTRSKKLSRKRTSKRKTQRSKTGKKRSMRRRRSKH